ncbi:hypothetical protein [Olleya sp. YS]|uniref:hypothetical protein n=1 Tax=Olleya sp. YS TaxID=3028318 RepID=UPI0024343334|nr:hypothetical protein [Olleya sp. YS]WGD34888.1 hypothetical protein Ollyesu_00395 [Olleya sp. YS]
MNEALIHILIVWSKGKSHLQAISQDISNSFNVLNTFQFSWKEELFHENLKRFYSHSQKDKTEAEFDAIITGKIEHCGSDDFTVLIFEDENPKFENRKTSNGITTVNTNVFDKKAKFRALTGGGHKIHASDNYFESNKDISFLLNTTLKDYKNNYKQTSKTINKKNNVLGVPFWKSIDELFFALNNSLEYVVLRNFDCLPNDYHVEGHGDIDLLVEHLNYTKYITGAKTAFPDLKHRVYHYININNEEVPFDFRYLGDDYYDKKWEFNILKNRQLSDYNFYIPDDKNHFYSLLYHAYVQKRHIAQDYKIKLETIAERSDINYNKTLSLKETGELLNQFMLQNGYQYSLPKDFSVHFNKKNIEFSNIQNVTTNLGTLITSSTTRTENESFFTEVYQTPNSIIKIASFPVSHNENRFLNTLKDSIYFPKVLSFSKVGDYDKVEIEKINGVSFLEINNIASFWSTSGINDFIKDLIDMLIELNNNDIIHRDIRPNNILVVSNDRGKLSPRLIDFGWSVYNYDKNKITPVGLGDKFKLQSDRFSDIYSVALTLNEYIGKFDFTKKTINSLIKVGLDSSLSKDETTFKLSKIKEQLNKKNKLSFNDRKQFALKKGKALIGVKNVTKIMSFLKRFKS